MNLMRETGASNERFVSDRTLTIKGEKMAGKSVDENDLYVSECSYGSFRRVRTLPFEPDAAKIEVKRYG